MLFANDVSCTVQSIKKARFTEYGGPEVVEVVKMPAPEPKGNELLIRVQASSLNAADWRIRKASPFMVRLYNGLLKPIKITTPGISYSGRVCKVGAEVSSFKVGDAVYGMLAEDFGCCSEQICVAEDSLVLHKMETISFMEAACMPFGALSAWYFMNDLAQLKADQKIMILGASGAVGSFATQFATKLGARVHTLSSTKNQAFCADMGASKTFSYEENYSAQIDTYDIIFDAVGLYRFDKMSAYLKENGQFVTTEMGLSSIWDKIKSSIKGSKKSILFGIAPNSKSHFELVHDWVTNKKLICPVDRTFDLHQIVDAQRYVESGRKRGTVGILVSKGEVH